MGWAKTNKQNNNKNQDSQIETKVNKSVQKKVREIARRMGRCTKYNLWEDSNIPLHIGPLFCVFISDKHDFNNVFVVLKDPAHAYKTLKTLQTNQNIQEMMGITEDPEK